MTLLKLCRCCHLNKPATTSHFHRHAGRRDGWHDECRECRSRQRKSAAERRQQADERTTIRRVAKLIREGQQVPEPERLVRFAYRHFGGADGVARAMAAVYDDPASTTTARMGVLAAFMRLLPAAEERERLEREQSERRLAAMNRDELERYLAALTGRYLALTTATSENEA